MVAVVPMGQSNKVWMVRCCPIEWGYGTKLDKCMVEVSRVNCLWRK